MTTPFGPQLIGETEKTLNALLLRLPRRHRPHRAPVGDAAGREHARRHRDAKASPPRSPTAPTSAMPQRKLPTSPRTDCSTTAASPQPGAAAHTCAGRARRRHERALRRPRTRRRRGRPTRVLNDVRRPRPHAARRAESEPGGIESTATLDRALQPRRDDRGGHVATGPLEHGAQRVGGAPQPPGERVGVVDGHEQPVDLVHQPEQPLGLLALVGAGGSRAPAGAARSRPRPCR